MKVDVQIQHLMELILYRSHHDDVSVILLTCEYDHDDGGDVHHENFRVNVYALV